MKSFIQFILEQNQNPLGKRIQKPRSTKLGRPYPWESMKKRVWRVDPVDRSKEDAFSSHDYAIYDNGTSPLPSGHNVKPGDDHGPDGKVRRIKKLTFASPRRPNSFYGAFPRKGSDGNPVRGAAVFDQDKMFGKNHDPNYRGQIHTTAADWKRVPRHVAIHSAHHGGWRTDPTYSGREEVTTEKSPEDVRHHGVVNTREFIRSQYDVVIHPDHKSIRRAVRKIQRDSPHLSALYQG